MDSGERAAYVNAQAVCALAEIAGMVAFNQQRLSLGHSIGYDECAFAAVPEKYGLHHNALMTLFRE